jgi:hypothetical protein
MRSGTTAIHRALCTARNSNPYVNEAWFLRNLMALYRMSIPRYDFHLADQFGELSNYQELMRLNVEYYLGMISARYGHPDVLILKHPELIQSVRELALLVPGFHFLAIVRDPRDVIASMKRIRERQAADGVTSLVTKFRGIAAMCAHFSRQYEGALGLAGEGLPLRIVRYEDVMRDPKTEIAAIGAFCGAEYDLEAIPAYARERAAGSSLDRDFRLKDRLSRAYWSDLYAKDLSPERIGRFAETLSAGEIAEIESRLGEFGRRFGYW